MTYVYSYDNAGNLISKKTYGLTAGGTTPTNHTDEGIYTYGNANWGDNETRYATYLYDAWGNHTVTYSNNGASIIPVENNPLRYRGYYYDSDLGLYYLQSRYYDSNTGRFINIDSLISLNLFRCFSINLGG